MAACYFYSFDYARWQTLLSGQNKSLLTQLEETLRNPDFFSFDDPEYAIGVALKATAEGLPYDAYGSDEAEALDCAVFAALKCPGRLHKSLDCTPKSPQGARIALLEAVAEAAPAECGSLFDALIDGRRFGSVEDAPDCGYVIFSPAEVQTMAGAIDGIISRLSDAKLRGEGASELGGVLKAVSQDPSLGLVSFFE